MSAFQLHSTTYPLVVVKKNAGASHSIVEAIGTAFFLSPALLLTAWHCVSRKLGADQYYAIRVSQGNGKFGVAEISEVERDVHGTDMATCRCAWTPPSFLPLAKVGADYGEAVWTFAFPHPNTSIKNGKQQFEISGRYLRGYVTRDFYYDNPGYGVSEVYELDMIAPAGASGAPLMVAASNEVVGLIVGEADIETVVEFAYKDDAGVVIPERIKLSRFGIAYDHDWFMRLTTSHTGGKPLFQFLGLQASSS